MSQQQIISILFEFVVLLFSLSLHEAAHAWTASRLGDQTARMLGRVTLNPIKHIDPIGTVLLPLAMLFLGSYGRFLIGWARPTPVNTRNFKNYVRGDVLTTLAGPASNLLAAFGSVILLVLLEKASPLAYAILHGLADPSAAIRTTVYPAVMILYMGVQINLSLFAFNLLPLPPLDGSHLVRHMLPYNALRIYDQMGMVSLFLMLMFGGRVINLFVAPALGLVDRVLLSL
jgi:Zn-dependent protease